MTFDCKDCSRASAPFHLISISHILTGPRTEVRHANSALGLGEFVMRITLQEGLGDYDQLEDCGTADLLVPWECGSPVRLTNQGEDEAHQERLRRAGKLIQLGLLPSCLSISSIRFLVWNQNIRRSHQEFLRSFGFSDSSAAVWAPEIDEGTWSDLSILGRDYNSFPDIMDEARECH
jgi:hypothetical protein